VRLALEEAGAPYRDVARTPGGMEAMLTMLRAARGHSPIFAAPFLKHGDRVIAQTANILSYLAPRLKLVPRDEDHRTAAMQIQLTIADLVSEVHDTHHPIGAGLYYEDQMAAAKKNAKEFLASRLPKFLAWLEAGLKHNDGDHLVGRRLSYVDLSAFQVVCGLRYAFPNAMAQARRIPRLLALHDRIGRRPRIAAYLASKRRVPFNEDGIFRHYGALDVRRGATPA
jgi:glutathione S-transferase